MPVTLEFSADNNTLVFTIAAPWTMDELFAAYPKAEVYFDAATEKLTSIVDILQIGSIPAGALRARNSPFMSHPMSGKQIIVAPPGFVRSMAETSLRLANYKRVQFCNSVAEAWSMINGETPRRIAS